MRSSLKRIIAGASLACAIGIGGAAVASAQSSTPQVKVPAATDPSAPSGSTPSAPDGSSPAGGHGGQHKSADQANCPNMGGSTQTPSSTPSTGDNAET